MKRGIESLYNEEGESVSLYQRGGVSHSLTMRVGRGISQSVTKRGQAQEGGAWKNKGRETMKTARQEMVALVTRESHKRSSKKKKQSLKVTEGTEAIRTGYSISQKNTERHPRGGAMEDRTTTKKICVEESLKTKTKHQLSEKKGTLQLKSHSHRLWVGCPLCKAGRFSYGESPRTPPLEGTSLHRRNNSAERPSGILSLFTTCLRLKSPCHRLWHTWPTSPKGSMRRKDHTINAREKVKRQKRRARYKMSWEKNGPKRSNQKRKERVRAQMLCESRGGRPGLSVLTSLMVSVDVKQYWTMFMHWSQLRPKMSTDIRGQ